MPIPLPSFVKTGLIRGRQVVVTMDTSADADIEPDAAYPLTSGSLTFTPSVPYLLFAGVGVDQPTTVYLTESTAVIGADGNPVTPAGDPLKLVATDMPGSNPTGWFWIVTPRIDGRKLPAFRLDVPANGTAYLTNAQPIPASLGNAVIRGVGVTAATVDSTGHLVLTFTDGSTVDAGLAKGPRGTDGVNTPAPGTLAGSVAVADGAGGVAYIAQVPTVATQADLAAMPASIQAGQTSDLPLSWIRDAPGGNWRRKDGTLVVPSHLSDPADPGKLARALKAFADASAAYTRTRTAYASTTTAAGMKQLWTGLGPELYFTPDQEWHLGPAALYNVGLRRKRSAFMLTSALQRLHADRTTFVWHDTPGANFGIATRYRPYIDDPIRANGDASQWDMTAAQEADYYSGGRGSGGRVQWRYAKTAQAVITGDVSRGAQTVPVDNVDGIDRAWFASRGLAIPASLGAAQLRVGSLVYVACGQNLNDAHERKDFIVCHIVAINGTTTPGYTTTGAGTITLSRPFLVDMVWSQQFWNYDGSNGSHWFYTPAANGGTENVESHAIWSVDPSLYCMHPHVGDFDFVKDPSAATAPSSWVAFQSCENSSFGHLRAFNQGLQVVDHNAVKGGYGRCVETLGVNPGTVALDNIGMTFDATTAQVRIDEVKATNYLGAVAQAESYSKIDVGKATLLDTHPLRLAGTSPKQSKGAFLVIGASEFVIDVLDLTTSDGRLAFVTTPDGADFKVKNRMSVKLLNATKRPTIMGTDISPTCSVKYDGFKADGSAPLSVRLSSRRAFGSLLAPYTKSTTLTRTLPAGLIGDGYITLPADTVGLTSLKLTNPALTGGISAVDLLSGEVVSDATGSTASTVDGGTDAERTVTSAGGGFAGAAAGDAFIWPGGNADGTTFVATVIDVSGLPGAIVLDTLLPRPLTPGTTVRVGDVAVAGKTVKLPQAALSFVNRFATRQSFNLGKLQTEAAGGSCFLSATFDGTVDDASGKNIVLDLECFPALLDLAGVAPITRQTTFTPAAAPVAPLYAYLSADAAPVTNTGAQTISAVLRVPVEANSTYRFTSLVWADATATGDLKLGWDVPAGTTGKWSPNSYQIGVAAAATSAAINRGAFDIGANASIGMVGAGASSSELVTAQGIIKTGSTAGYLSLKYAQQTAEASDLVIRAMSEIEAVKLPV